MLSNPNLTRVRRALALIWVLVVLALLGHNAYLWLGKRITPNTDILALLPVQERDPVLQQSFSHMVDAAQQRVVILIGATEWDDAKRAANAYQAVLKARPDLLALTEITEKNQSDWLKPFQSRSLTLLSAPQTVQLRTEPPEFWTQAALANLYGAFAGPKFGAFQDDPFGTFSAWVQERAQETPVRPRDGYLFVADAHKQYVLLSLQLTQSAFSLRAQEAVLPLLAQSEQAAKKSVPTVEIIRAGVILHAAAAGQQASSEVSTIGAGSMLGVVLLMWLSFRSFKPMTLIVLSIAVGFLGALSVCWLLFGSIHLMTLVFGASLIGVAQDYGLYFLCSRLHAERDEDSWQLLRRLMPGLLLTLSTTVLGYIGLALTPFPGLRHMAVFSAVGLVFSWLTVVLWFPHLLGAHSLRSGRLLARYSDLLPRWPRFAWNRTSLIVLLVFGVSVAWGCSRLTANDDIRLLQNSPAHLISDQIKLGKLLDAPTPVQYFLVRGANEEIVLQREEALKRKLDPMIAAQRITGYQAISNWVPSDALQAERLQLIQTRLLDDGAALTQLAAQVGEDAQWTQSMRKRLLQSANRKEDTKENANGNANGNANSVDAFLASPAGEPWRHLWLGKIDQQYASIVALRGLSYANGGLLALQSVGKGIDGVQWVDKVGEISSVLKRYRIYMGWVLLSGYLLVFAMLYPRYRRNAWRVLLPTLLASVATVALLGAIGQPLQLFHVLALMLLLGVGVDFGIFMQEPADVRRQTPWTATGLSATSTILSFGLLALSHTPALRAFGLTMLVGTALAWWLAPCFAVRSQDELGH